MRKASFKVIGISGSLRPTSSASAVLAVVKKLFPAYIEFEIYDRLENIPAFNDSREIPAVVNDFINLIADADGVFFCIPEYAFGIPGALKNALDWTVSSTAFTDKPVALITAASQGQKAHAALLLTLSAIGTRIEKESQLVISFIRTKLDEENNIKDILTFEEIRKLVDSFIKNVEGD